jgi:adenylate cyclase class IV
MENFNWQITTPQLYFYMYHVSSLPLKEEFEDNNGAIRIRISKNRQRMQWPKEKVQKDKQRSTKHTYKTKDRVTRTPLKTVGSTQVLRKG